MDNWFKSKWFVRILALVFALFIYSFVNVSVNTSGSESTFTESDQTHTLDDVPVEIEIDEEQYVVSGVPEFATLRIEGSIGSVRPLLLQRNFDVLVDLRDLGVGQHVVDLQHTVPEDVNVTIEPQTVEVTIEERASKEFPVAADFINEGEMEEGMEVTGYEINPSSVTITSSKSIIDQVGAVKVFVNLNGVASSMTNRDVPVNVYDIQGNELDVHVEPELVQIAVEVDNPSKTVPVSIETTGELPEGLTLGSITPGVEEISVFGASGALESVEEVTTKAIDLSDITESSTMEVALQVPEGVSSLGTETIEVTVEVTETPDDAEQAAEIEDTATAEDEQETAAVSANEPETESADGETGETEKPAAEQETPDRDRSSQLIEGIKITAEELGEGLSVQYLDPPSGTVNIEVSSEQAEITKEAIRASIQLEGLTEGEHTVPLVVSGPEAAELSPQVDEVRIAIEAAA